MMVDKRFSVSEENNNATTFQTIEDLNSYNSLQVVLAMNAAAQGQGEGNSQDKVHNFYLILNENSLLEFPKGCKIIG